MSLIAGGGRAEEQQEEVYNFRSDPRANGATVILTVDTSSFQGKSVYPGTFLPFICVW
jgi:hypothetical protein